MTSTWTVLLVVALPALAGANVPAPSLQAAGTSSQSSNKEHPAVRPVCGSLAACTAEALTMPIDIAKVRMQLAPSDSKLGFSETMSSIVKSEGTGALFKGLKPALLRQASYQGLKMYLYEPIRDAVLDKTTPEVDKGKVGPKLWQMILAGGLAGAIGTFLTSPTDLIKIRMQSGVAYGGVIDALLSIVAASGVLSLWDGWQPNVQRSFIVNAAELATYDYFKQLLLKAKIFGDGLLVHTLASSGAGLVAALCSTPVDRAKTLLMTDRAKYGSVFSCLAKIASEDGLSGLYKGFLATWMRLGPWAFLFFVCFEQFRALAVGIQERLEAPAAAKRK